MRKKKDYRELLEKLIKETIEKRGIKDRRVLEALRSIPRHLFIPGGDLELAYSDHPVPIGYGQTISQPYMVAYMLKELELEPHHKVLEIGTGSGYNAALLSKLAKEVYTVEYVPELARRAKNILTKLGIDNVHVFVGDGSMGLPEYAPYDRIIATCSAPQIPEPLVSQLKTNGILLVPVNEGYYDMLKKVRKLENGRIEVYDLMPCAFVPMRGAYGF